jgi:hypothetical protein
MAITVEDGTGLGLANSYATAEEFVAYATDRGLTTISEADTDQQEIALIKAADYLQQKFRLLTRLASARCCRPGLLRSVLPRERERAAVISGHAVHRRE